jgi:hypothetical protein
MEQMTRTVRSAVLGIAMAMAMCPVAVAKKDDPPKTRTVRVSQTVGQTIPNSTTTADGRLESTLRLKGRKLADRKISDVNVTVQTIGTGGNAAGELRAILTAPSGASTWLFGGGLTGPNIGPLTLDDDTPMFIGLGLPRSPEQLGAAYQGTAQPVCFFAFGSCSLSTLDDGRVRGAWILRMYDTTGAQTSTLIGWSLEIKARAVASKKRN